MSYLGDIRLGDTIDFKFCTVQASGAPTTLAGSPVISAYPNNSTTQLTAGITLSVDFDSVTGLNNVRVVASNGNGYATATNYDLVITTGTVNSVSAVGYVVGSFSIEARSALMPTTATRTLDVSAGGEAGVDWANVGSPTTANNLSGTSTKAVEPTVAGRTLDVSAGGEAGLDWANVGSPTTTQNLSGTTISAVSGAVGSVTGAVGSVTGNVGGNVTGSVGSVVGAVGSVTGAVGSVAGNVGGNVVGTVAGVVGNVGGNVTGSVGSVVGNVGGNVLGGVGGNLVGSVLGDVVGHVGGDVLGGVAGNLGGNVQGNLVGNVGGDVTGSVGSLAAQAKTDVKAQVVAGLSTDNYGEPTGVPAASTNLAAKIGRVYQSLRNGVTVTATNKTFQDDNAADLWKKPLSDDGTTYTEGEGVAP